VTLSAVAGTRSTATGCPGVNQSARVTTSGEAIRPGIENNVPVRLDFADLAAQPEPSLDRLALAIAAEFREVDTRGALRKLDVLGEELAPAAGSSPSAELEACRLVLAERHGFAGDRDEYDRPDNSMLDLVLERRRGLPILLSVVYVETARRAGIALAGVGLAGHFVAGHFGADPPLLLDPFGGGVRIERGVVPRGLRPWRPHETALRMLNNLEAGYRVRGDVGNAIRAAELRLLLPLEPTVRQSAELELRKLRAKLN
jgi:regulator of sirC expression with transglutaminase-like and TPR domain